MQTFTGRIPLSQHLARRLYPVAVLIGILISLGFPASYFILESAASRQLATTYAGELSEQFHDLILEAPDLWKYQAQKYIQVLSHYLVRKDVTRIQILDEIGQPISGYEYTTPTTTTWWNRHAPQEPAPILFNNRRIGTVRVSVSRGPLLRNTLMFLLLSTVVGTGLALFICRFPVKVATGLERELQALVTAVQRSNEELSALLEANKVIGSSLDLEQILTAIVHQAAAISGAPFVRLLLLDENAGVLRCRVGTGLPPDLEREIAIPVGESFSGQVVAIGQPLAVADCRGDPRLRYPEHTTRHALISYLGLPVQLERRSFGILVFNTAEPRIYRDEEISYLSAFAQQAAIAIENARLYSQVQGHAVELEAKVRDRTAELEEALRVKAEFLAKMSHELRTPLNHVLGFAELLKQGTGGPLTPKQAHYIDRIHMGGRHLLELVDDILELSLAETAPRRLRLETIPFAPLVDEVQEVYQVQAAQKHLTLDARLEPELVLVADRRKMIRILSNLLRNAVKFTPEGGTVRVTARQVQSLQTTGAEVQGSKGESAPRPPGPSAPQQFIEIVVQDTGIGIPPGDMERIFHGFEQVDGSPTRAFGGAGIGLPLVRALVELHGGHVWAESGGPGTGARFVVRLPLLRVPPPKRILIVEDDARILDTICIFLRDAGYSVEGVTSGAGAFAALRANAPDLLILDLGLPDLDGMEVLRQVREAEGTRALPVLVLTGQGQDQVERATALGANELLTKPVSLSVLTGILRDLLEAPDRNPRPLKPVE